MENMFYNCTNLTSINLESFTIPSVTNLSRMFYNSENLEYINIENFEEKQNINLNEMFCGTPQNAVICLSSCPPPTNFTITSITTSQVTISWKEYEWNNFIISYGLQSLLNPDIGTKIKVTNSFYYTITNLNQNNKYNIYIKTDCGKKTSYWVGPLLISISKDSYNMAHTGNKSIKTCSKIIYDSGGPNRRLL